MVDNKTIRQANRKAWNEVMPYHRKAKDEEWDKEFSNSDFIIQDKIELEALKKLNIIDKNIVHLCCNNGLELLSLKRLGAGRCVGFDIADEAIKDGNRRAEKFSIPVEFYQSDVFEIPNEYNEQFDIVYITIGALVWLPDLKEFFAVANRLLRANGKLFIYESHPFSQVLPWDVTAETGAPEIKYTYFTEGYQVYNDGIDYYGGADYVSEDCYEFEHTLSTILNAIMSNGFIMQSFDEYSHDISNGLKWVESLDIMLPLSYILVAKKVK